MTGTTKGPKCFTYVVPIALKNPYYPMIARVSNLKCDPAGTRTQDPYIKSVLLYQLSYGIEPFPSKKRDNPFFFGSAKIGEIENQPNFYKSILSYLPTVRQ
jgi:hypothetical protein